MALNLRAMATRAARANGIPVNLFLKLIGVESGWQAGIVSSAGAIGLTQLMPGTARGLGVDPHNPAQNLQGGARYLRAMYDKFGSWPLALAAYNAGAGAVEQHGGIPPYPETQHYVQMILGGSHVAAPAPKMPGLSMEPTMTSTPTTAVGAPTLADVGIENLSGHASPFQQLENLTAAVRGGLGSPVIGGGGGGSVSPVPIVGGGKGLAGIAKTAMKYIGTPYVWGGTSPNGFDCSGLLQYAAAQNGIHIKRTTYDQWQQGRAVAPNQLQPGDAVFFRGSDARGNLPGHVGIYIGHGEFIEAPHTGATVRVSRLAGRTDYVGARRY